MLTARQITTDKSNEDSAAWSSQNIIILRILDPEIDTSESNTFDNISAMWDSIFYLFET